jgi:hypothetical protein
MTINWWKALPQWTKVLIGTLIGTLLSLLLVVVAIPAAIIGCFVLLGDFIANEIDGWIEP